MGMAAGQVVVFKAFEPIDLIVIRIKSTVFYQRFSPLNLMS